MFWFALAHLVAFLVDLIVGGRRHDRDQDRQILVLRHQVRLLQRQRPRPPRLTRGEERCAGSKSIRVGPSPKSTLLIAPSHG